MTRGAGVGRAGFASFYDVGSGLYWTGTMNRPGRIVLGVTGSIAAHKAIDLTSQLTRLGHVVDVVLTVEAQRFVTALPFKTLARRPVITGMYDEEQGWKPSHIAVADEADLLLVAPATANTIAHLSLGLAEDALGCIALALKPEARLLVAPAMNGRMWLHPATQAHVATLRQRGAEILGPAEGMLSCGYEGIGRLLPVEAIVARVVELLAGVPG